MTNTRFLHALIASVALMTAHTAEAACDTAERMRLEEEAKKLASRNAWAGVERAYESLEKMTECQLPFEDHFLGSQSARFLGKIYQMYQRLERARALDATEEIVTNIDGIMQNFGRVRLKGNERNPPPLTREVMPFAPDQRKAIEWAQLVVSETGKFEGMLPSGDYKFGDTAFSVTAGQEFVDIAAGKVKPGPKPKPGEQPTGEQPAPTERKGVVLFHGPVASIGPSFLTSPQPAPVDGDTSIYQPQGTGFGAGLSVNGGYELVFTKVFSVAATVGYNGTYGLNTYHGINGWLAAAIRPGDWRFAAGPTYTTYIARGTGIADWFDVGHDKAQFPSDTIAYQGLAWGGGAAISAGYGLLDLDPLQGVVELGGSFTSTGDRVFISYGLRVGIVPKIRRFKE